MQLFTTYILFRGDEEIELDITYNYDRGWADDPGSLQIDDVTLAGVPFDLSESETDELLRYLDDNLMDELADRAADEADYRYNMWKEREYGA